jgi:hypothetical protein
MNLYKQDISSVLEPAKIRLKGGLINTNVDKYFWLEFVTNLVGFAHLHVWVIIFYTSYMSNKFVYLLLLLFPLVVNYFVFEFSGDTVGFLFLGFYLFLYRPFVDSFRLLELGEIGEEEMQNWLIPFAKPFWYPFTHFRVLFL